MTTSRTISTSFKEIGLSMRGIITIVYGPNIITTKLYFPKIIHNIGAVIDQNHWIIGEEFNIITSMSEKGGGTRWPYEDNVLFKNNNSKLKLIDMTTNNCCHTYINKLWGKNKIEVRSDHFLILESLIQLRVVFET